MKTKGFTTNNNVYPTTLITYSLGDLQPDTNGRSYIILDHSDDDDYLESHDYRDTEIQIPNRVALYQLVTDICNAISNEAQTYLNMGTAPLDDATNDIEIATNLLNDLTSFDSLLNE